MLEWVPFLTKTGPILVPLFKKRLSLFDPRDLSLQGPELATLQRVWFFLQYVPPYMKDEIEYMLILSGKTRMKFPLCRENVKEIEKMYLIHAKTII